MNDADTSTDFVPVDSTSAVVPRSRRRARRRVIWAVLGSTALHIVGIGVAIWLVLWAAFAGEDAVAGNEDEIESRVVERKDEPEADDEAELVDVAERADVDGPGAESEAAKQGDSVLPVPDESFDWQAFATNRFSGWLDRANEASDEERTRDLDRLEMMLGATSNERNVAEMAESLSGWLGANGRKPVQRDDPEQPIEDDPEFDFDTAQVEEVVVEPDGEGRDVYFLVLADAEGRLHRAETDEANGRRLKTILDRVKANPLLETIYRGVVMGIIDKLADE